MPSAIQVGVTSIPIDLSAQYLSGGAASGLPVTLRSQIQPDAYVFFPDFEDFTFANGEVKEGTVTSESEYQGFEITKPPGIHQRKDLTLDAAGGVRTDITDIARSATPISVSAEMEYRDPNGETQTVSNSITIWPAKWLVGIRADDWVSSPGHVRFRVAVVKEGGKAGRRRAGAGRNFHSQDVLVSQAPGRRILRLRQHDRDAPCGRIVLRRHRRARSAAVRREDLAHRIGAGAGVRA